MNIKKYYRITKITFYKLSRSMRPIKSKIKSRIDQHRLAIRLIINSTPLNFITIASILPFFLGFYDFINQNQQLKKILFQKNIPGFSIPTESLNWDTFHYFKDTKKDFLVGIENVQWSPNSLFLTKNVHTELFDQEYFIASFNNTNDSQFMAPDSVLGDHVRSDTDHKSFTFVNKENFLSLQNFGLNKFYLNSLNKQPVVSFLQTFYLNLDEVPLKLDNLNSYYTFSTVHNNAGFSNPEHNSLTILPFHETFWNENTNRGFHNFSFSEKTNAHYIDLLLQLDIFHNKQIPAVSQFNFSNVSNKIKGLDSGSFSHVDLPVRKSQAFTNSFAFPNIKETQTSCFLQKLQYKTQSSLESSFFPLNEKNNLQQNDINYLDSLNNLEELVLDLENVLQEQDFSSLRRMSGYSYPDMNSKEVKSFLVHNLFSYLPKNLGFCHTTQNGLKIIFPANPAFIKQYSFSNPKIPTKFSISIYTGLVNFKDFDTKDTLYNNLAVFLDSKNGLDWQLKESLLREGDIKEIQNYRFYLENYLSPINPLTQSSLITTKSDLKIDNSRNIFFSQDDIIIPFLNENEWKKIYNQNKISQESSSDYKVNSISLPVSEISLPNSKYNYARLNYNLNSTLDYFYSPQIFITKTHPLSSSHGEFFNETFSPVNYKKLISIFSQPQFLEKTFSDNWEPLSFGSWLLISQIGFAYLFFNFVKSIISDYFSELIGFIVDFGLAVGIFDANLKEEIEIATGLRDKGFRIISKTKKKFQDIAGINTLLPEIAEIVWFLRNSGKDFAESKNFPRGLLLIGPPGTGKTVLVQALAGEAKVPAITLSGSSLVAPGESGALKLEILFQEARQLAPCIVFIDEIDSLAEKRKGVMQNPMGGDEILSVLEPMNASLDFGTLGTDALASGTLGANSPALVHKAQTSFFKKTDQIASLTTNSTEFGEDKNSTSSNKIALEIKQQLQAQEKSQQQKLTLLMQLLIELDGIQGRKGVVVIGATNRPELLDPAILRPGRFDKILELGLPSYKKRLDIFKLYGRRLGYDENISWEYLAKRTVGFTPADLASIMNQSSLKVILNDKTIEHNLETIEHGIDRITTSEIEKTNNKVPTIFLNRIAYYQAGKILLSTVLEHHPPTFISYLWPRRQNRRSLQILTNLQKYFFQFARRSELEHRIVGCYGGKAAEILLLQNSPVNVSSFGLEDLSFAFVLSCFTIEKWYLYSKSTLINQLTQIISNKNSKELIPEKIELFKELAYSMELSPHLLYSHETDLPTYPFSQNFFSNTWWQLEISQQLEFVERNFADWYRLYLPNPEETEKNIEWSPPDEFYHGNVLNKQVNKNSSITWNDLHNIARDYQVHAFILQSFNKALALVDENREFLDKLVVELLKREVLRQSDIEKLASSFIPVTKQTIQKSSIQDISAIKIVNNSFGQMSRRKIKNWIDFKDFEN